VRVDRTRVAQGVLRFGDHARERRAQLVRELRREPLLVTQAGGDAVEQAVGLVGRALARLPLGAVLREE
jgi:hypothetical protein